MSDLEIYTEEDMKREAFARILLTGHRKIGKSTAIATSAPGPIGVLNIDGRDALQPAKRHGAKGLQIVDVTSADVWKKGVTKFIQLAGEGKVKTIMVDTFSILVNDKLTLEYKQKYRDDKNKFAAWDAVMDDALRYVHKLLQAPAHIFLICHVSRETGDLVLNTQLQERLPALINDIVHMEFNGKEADADRKRTFRYGPDVSGLSGGRSSDENKVIPADASLLLRELGYNVP